ncbi:hypothetical protein GGTG_07610 [Gaeumannomyces tritici R3-111a-1]|uniref:Uncharacterized protein n=1 Tax=Gaeumannomyces tritici (strain R3-111a-1) TaxID=644352 RepID=J3P262_GAET3|nr:hypothetical protein GGTG_07610 [Gaeumannomyces tritici R3-111a-1]EJT73754.1 hypothetical protein GGTG_07610 [Gaeumannomyces tritici R3-111a-1]
MAPLTRWLLALAGFGIAAGQNNKAAGPDTAAITRSAPAALPQLTGRYIVRFTDTGSARFRKRDGGLDADAFFRSALGGSGSGEDGELRGVKQQVVFDSDLFRGASFTIDTGNASRSGRSAADTLARLRSLPEVEAIWPAGVFTIIPRHDAAAARQVAVDAAAAANGTYARWSPHGATGVAAVHALGHRGAGVRIAVVDSGVDYNHPSLGGGFGPGFKVEGGFDFVGDNWDPKRDGQTYKPDDDPMDCNGHGTHVAGIVASGSESVPGVAPAARLWSYKVFGCASSTYEDVIIAAFLRARGDGADIITASLGSSLGFPDSALATVVSAVAAEGIFVSIAAGNSGNKGPFYTSDGGNGRGVASVGSIDHDELVGYTVLAKSSSGESREIAYLSHDSGAWDIAGRSLPAAFARTREAYTPCTVNRPGVARNTVFVNPRRNCGWQLHDTALSGQVDYVFYSNFKDAEYVVPDRAYYDPARQPKGFGLISYEDGNWLYTQNERGNAITFQFATGAAPEPVGLPVRRFAGGRMSAFSSWGPTIDARFSPVISAPGGGIFSTFPTNQGSWAVLSGTSMATPYIAGVAALFYSSRGGRSSLGRYANKAALDRIIASGRPVLHTDSTQNPASVSQQGAGLVDALKVVLANATLSPSLLALNDTDHFSGTQSLTVTNAGSRPAFYNLTHEPGITTLTRPRGDVWFGADPPYESAGDGVATVELPGGFLLQPGESRKVPVAFKAPVGPDPKTLPVYGGRIRVVSDTGEALSVAYMGIKSSLRSIEIWDSEAGVPFLMSTAGGFIQEGAVFAMNGTGERPQAYYMNHFSTREMSFDFVDRDWTPSDWTYPPVPGKNKLRGHMLSEPVGLAGVEVAFPMVNAPRDQGGIFMISQTRWAHGEEIPAGEYRLLGRVLRNFGDPARIEDWQWAVSAWFRVTKGRGA